MSLKTSHILVTNEVLPEATENLLTGNELTGAAEEEDKPDLKDSESNHTPLHARISTLVLLSGFIPNFVSLSCY